MYLVNDSDVWNKCKISLIGKCYVYYLNLFGLSTIGRRENPIRSWYFYLLFSRNLCCFLPYGRLKDGIKVIFIWYWCLAIIKEFVLCHIKITFIPYFNPLNMERTTVMYNLIFDKNRTVQILSKWHLEVSTSNCMNCL